MVPSGWEKHPVGKICRSIVPGRNKPKEFSGSIPWVTTPEIKGRYIPSLAQQNYVSTEALSECGGKIVPRGAVVMAAVGELGLVAIASEEVVLNQQLHAFVCSGSVHNEYLAYWLSSQKPYMETIASKTTIPYLNKTNCESIPVALPPLPEQRKIATILGTWDKAISTTERLIDNSKQQKKALMQQLLTGKKRLLDESGKPFKDEWEQVNVGSLITKHSEKTDRSGQYPVLTSSRKGIMFQSDYYNDRDVASEDNTGYNVVPRGFFTYRHMSDDIVFKFNINTICDKGIVSTLYPVFAAKENKIIPYFLQSLLNEGNEFKRFSLAQKQGGSRTYMYLSKLNELRIHIPDINEQKKIALVLYGADKEIKLLEQQLADLKQEKKALMQQLLTGKRRVKVDDKEVA